MERRGGPTDRATVPPSVPRVPLTSAYQLLANPSEALAESRGSMHQRGAAGFSVTWQYIPFPNRSDRAHVLYVLSRKPLSATDRDRIGLGQ